MEFNSYQHEVAYARLRDEWADIITRQQIARREDRRKTVERWEREIERLYHEHQHLIREGLWVRGPSDVLSIIGQERREVYHSAMLAWLLDPLAPHGFGSGFLSAFLSTCHPEWLDSTSTPVRVDCEVVRGDCRADIVVWTGDLVVVIENKVDALEGDRQCDRLHAAFSGDYDARFVFLTPNGQSPSTATGEAREAFRSISYRRVTTILEGLIAEHSGNNLTQGQMAAHSYLITLKREFA